MHKTLIAAAMTTVLSGVTALPLTAQMYGYNYKSTRTCSIPPGGNGSACITVRWQYYVPIGAAYRLVRPMSVTYINYSTNGIATFNPNYYFGYTVNRGSCVQPYVGLQSYGSVQMGPSTGPRTILRPNTTFLPESRCPAWSTPVRLNNGSTVTLTSRWSDPSV
jgi:hypothetical protein